MKPPSRTLTTFAVGFLLLDAVLLVYGGVALDRLGLVVAGGGCAVSALVVVMGWRRYRRTLADLERTRRELRVEVESIRELLHSRHIDN